MSKNRRTGPAVVILAAGQGKRMKSELPKVVFDLAGWPLIRHVIEAAKPLKAARTIAVTGHGRKLVEAAIASAGDGGTGVETVLQREQKGTGHAVRCAEKALKGFDGDVMVLLGDVPNLRPALLRELLTAHRRRKAAATILTMIQHDPTGYGRVLRDERGEILAIREEKDASPEERAVTEVNSGIMVFKAGVLWPALRKLKADNAQGEYYLTDVPGFLIGSGEKVLGLVAPDPDDVAGANSLGDLAELAWVARQRILEDHMARGVRIVDPSSVHIDRGVKIGAGTTIFPFTVITGDVTIGKGCEVGPFSHLRTGARLKDGAQVGNFVEVKKSVVGKGTKAKHLTYLGDAVIGEKTNIGCGTITANYDGVNKHRTTIGDRVHVGSGTVFVAPVTVGNDSTTGAGAIVPAGRDVPEGETVAGVPARVLPRKTKRKTKAKKSGRKRR